MSNCPSCKTKLTKSAKFCFSCGFKMPEKDSNIDYDLEFLKRTLEPQFTGIQKIGQGGMGSIYLGNQVSLNRPVVIKLLNESLALDKKIVKNFLKEAQIAANIKHPNIVEMVDYGTAEGRPFFIMEYGEKGSLEKLLAELRQSQKKLPSLEVCKFMIKLLHALDFAHSKDLRAHRDIKPHNIILRESGEIFITDFGIALSKSEVTEENLDQSGSIDYMSPEQIQGSKDIDARSDVYSMGILFFEMLTCSVPFHSLDSENVKAMHLTSELPDLTKRFTKEELLSIEKEEVPINQLQLIIRKACEKDKNKRYTSCKEMADAIERIVQKIAEENTVSFKFNMRKLTVYEFVLCTLLAIVSYPQIRSYFTNKCNNCCVEGNCIDGKGKYVKDDTVFTGRFYSPSVNDNQENLGFFTKTLNKILPSGSERRELSGSGYITGKLEGGYFRYTGKFKDSDFTDTGILTIAKDENFTDKVSSYSGDFLNGLPHGNGSLYFFKKKTFFIGEFDKGKPVGEFIQYNIKNKKLYKGPVKTIQKENSSQVEILPDGQGILILPDGSISKTNY